LTVFLLFGGAALAVLLMIIRFVPSIFYTFKSVFFNDRQLISFSKKKEEKNEPQAK